MGNSSIPKYSKMRVGIITLPLSSNYGGILQAYALQTVLQQMGHEVCLIEKKDPPLRLPLRKMPLAYGVRMIIKLRRQQTSKFIHTYIKQRIVDDFSDLTESDFDTLVVGSDQVWRPKYFGRCIKHAYLDFTKGWNIRRIAYAVSFGSEEWEYTTELTQQCKEWVKQFDAVSVREDSAIELCRTHLEVKAKHVLDPTLLLTKEDYIRLLTNRDIPKDQGTLFNYILDETLYKQSVIDKITKEKGLTPFQIHARFMDAPLSNLIQPPVEQWLRGFVDAKFVITDSFHGCVFSILFNKPFLALANKERGMARFHSLLSMFGLEDRLITDCNKLPVPKDIDWNQVNTLLGKYRSDSTEFLNKALIES